MPKYLAQFERKSLLPPPLPAMRSHPFEHGKAADFERVVAIARRGAFDRMPLWAARKMHRKLLPIGSTWPLERVFKLSTTRLWHAGWPAKLMLLPTRFDRQLRAFWLAHLFWCLRQRLPIELSEIIVKFAVPGL